MARVYVSSTFSDLQECREQVRLALRRMGHIDMAMEYYVAEDRRPLDRCLADVANCDLYLGIFAFRYGYIPKGHTQSITELEFRKAVETGKDCLIFLAQDASWPLAKVEIAALAKINALRDELTKDYLTGFFTSKDDIGIRVVEAIRAWEQSRGLTGAGKQTSWEAYKQAVYEELRWIRLTVVAGARHDRVERIPVTEVFVPQMTIAGQPIYEITEEQRELQRQLFKIEWLPEAIEEEIILESDEGELAEPENDYVKESDEQEFAAEIAGISQGFPELSLDIIGRELQQVVLGGPGLGKSTLLHYTMLLLCEPECREDTLPRHLAHTLIPFLIDLRQYALKRASDFVSYLVDHTRERYDTPLDAESLRALFGDKRRALVLFDGLDEVFDPFTRSQVIQQFQLFARKYPDTQIVVTSRIVGYDKTDLGVAGFQHYTLLDFSLQQIRQFVPKWYHYYTWEGDERDANGLVQRIVESPRLTELAGNPLLLTMMAVIYKHQDLPEQRWKLYQRCTEVLLEDWDIKRKSIDLKTLLPLDIAIRAPQKAKILQRVSMYMLEHGQAGRELNAIAYQPLMSILADYLQKEHEKSPGDAAAIAQDILNHLRERTYILAEVGEGIFGFVHRTFMEYFAASYCQAQFNALEADYDWLKEQLFGARWRQDEWQEVLLLLIAMLADQGSPVQKVVDYLWSLPAGDPPSNLAFAARCLAEARKIDDLAQAQKLIVKLVGSISEHSAQTRKKETAFVEEGLTAFSSLAPLIDTPPAAQMVISELELSKILRQRMAGWRMGLALRSKHERQEYALAALKDREEAVRRAAIAALESEWPGNSDVGQALLDVFRSDRQGRVRLAALEAFQRGWPSNTAILDAIESRIEKEDGYTYLIEIIESLASNWRGHPRGITILQKCARWRTSTYSSELERIVLTVLEALVIGWRDHAGAFPLLRGLIIEDSNTEIRGAAIDLLGRSWHEHPETLPLLHDRARNDPDPRLRATALIQIAAGWREHPETLPLLRDRVQNDPHLWPRAVAVDLIDEGWSEHHKTLPLLLDPAD